MKPIFAHSPINFASHVCDVKLISKIYWKILSWCDSSGLASGMIFAKFKHKRADLLLWIIIVFLIPVHFTRPSWLTFLDSHFCRFSLYSATAWYIIINIGTHPASLDNFRQWGICYPNQLRSFVLSNKNQMVLVWKLRIESMRSSRHFGYLSDWIRLSFGHRKLEISLVCFPDLHQIFEISQQMSNMLKLIILEIAVWETPVPFHGTFSWPLLCTHLKSLERQLSVRTSKRGIACWHSVPIKRIKICHFYFRTPSY